MKLEDYKVVLYRQQDGSWVAEIPANAGCYALMETREARIGAWGILEIAEKAHSQDWLCHAANSQLALGITA